VLSGPIALTTELDEVSGGFWLELTRDLNDALRHAGGKKEGPSEVVDDGPRYLPDAHFDCPRWGVCGSNAVGVRAVPARCLRAARPHCYSP
jgi:hypothetical protein